MRVLLLTARGTVNDMVQGVDVGADDYLVKPFSPMELLAPLKRLLAK
jgi:DNA-binding response OmpR family regulator